MTDNTQPESESVEVEVPAKETVEVEAPAPAAEPDTVVEQTTVVEK